MPSPYTALIPSVYPLYTSLYPAAYTSYAPYIDRRALLVCLGNMPEKCAQVSPYTRDQTIAISDIPILAPNASEAARSGRRLEVRCQCRLKSGTFCGD